jgi:hypothetical protein
MVVRSGLEIQLVYADTKIPMKEFEKDGKIYVEVEPDVEYFIAIHRVAVLGPPIILGTFTVDDVALGYRLHLSKVIQDPKYYGIWSRVNGVSQQTALKFSKPRATSDGGGGSYQGGMGKVVINLHEGIANGTYQVKDRLPGFASATLSANDVNVEKCKKKFLLSTQGDATVSTDERALVGASAVLFKNGKPIDTVELNYCSAFGLIEVGVLPKPDLWTYQRMKRPAPRGQRAASAKKAKDPVDPGKDIELFDLTDD